MTAHNCKLKKGMRVTHGGHPATVVAVHPRTPPGGKGKYIDWQLGCLIEFDDKTRGLGWRYCENITPIPAKPKPKYSKAQLDKAKELSVAHRELHKLPPEQYADPPSQASRTLDAMTKQTVAFRTFESGATRDQDTDKPDYAGFMSAEAMKAFGAYMHAHRRMSDGSYRDSSNWKKGIPHEAYLSSAFRHFHAVWLAHERGEKAEMKDLCGLFFNVQGMLHEAAKSKEAKP